MRKMFLLGAGSSREAGVPLTSEMTEQLVNVLNSDSRANRDNLAQALNFVCGAIVAHDSSIGGNPYAGLDIERVLSGVQLLSQRSELEVAPFVSAWHDAVSVWDDPWPDWLGKRFRQAVFDTSFGDNAVEELLKAAIHSQTGRGQGDVYRKLMDRMTLALCQLAAITDPARVAYLEPIVALSQRQGLLAVATLNYDRSIELLGDSVGHPVETGIIEWSASGSWHWPDSGIRLLKLHGSIDWSMTIDYGGAGQLTESRILAPETPNERLVPAVIFGQRDKLRADGPFLDLLAQFRVELDESQELIVLGYSFRDQHINEFLRRWINADMARRLIVVDPNFPLHGYARTGPEPFSSQLLRNLVSPPPGVTNVFDTRLKVMRASASAALPEVIQEDWWDSH